MLTVDVHAHAHVPAIDDLVRGRPGLAAEMQQSVEWLGAASTERNAALFQNEWKEALTDPGVRQKAMRRASIDIQVVSVSPLQYHYWADASLAQDIVAGTNEGIAKVVSASPGNLIGMATVALRFPELAAAQLDLAFRTLGLRGVEVPTHAGGMDFSDPSLEPFWATAEELGAVVFVHPWGCTLGPRLAKFYLGNVVGNPTETTLALLHLIHGGVLDRHPNLRVCAAHGGGYLPQYLGRSDHAWEVRAESRTCARKPSEYLPDLWFDSLVYRSDTLRALIEAVGHERVVLGTDYPFDMGETDPVGRLADVRGLRPEQRTAILGSNAAALFGIRQESNAAVARRVTM